MTTTATATRRNGQRAPEGARPGSTRTSGRHRQLPLVVVGVLLVVGCALAFTDASLHLGSAAYSTEAVIVTALLAALALTAVGIIVAKVVSSANNINTNGP
jgi:hypothetical protein